MDWGICSYFASIPLGYNGRWACDKNTSIPHLDIAQGLGLCLKSQG